MGAEPVNLRIKILKMGKIAHADRPPANLVFICGANAASGRADLELACIFAQAIKVAVEWQDQWAIICNLEVFGRNGDTLPGQLRHFIPEMPRVEHHAIADD